MPRDARGTRSAPLDVPCARGTSVPWEARMPRDARATRSASVDVPCARGMSVPRDVGAARAALGVASAALGVASARGMNVRRDAFVASARAMSGPREVGAASAALGMASAALHVASARGMNVRRDPFLRSARGMSVPREIGSLWPANARTTANSQEGSASLPRAASSEHRRLHPVQVDGAQPLHGTLLGRWDAGRLEGPWPSRRLTVPVARANPSANMKHSRDVRRWRSSRVRLECLHRPASRVHGRVQPRRFQRKKGLKSSCNGDGAG